MVRVLKDFLHKIIPFSLNGVIVPVLEAFNRSKGVAVVLFFRRLVEFPFVVSIVSLKSFKLVQNHLLSVSKILYDR